jgi:hypothetical protein
MAIINIAVIIGGVAVGIFVLAKWAPNIRLKIDSWWLDTDKGRLVLRLTIENVSIVYVKKNHIVLQVLSYKVEQQTHLSEWVPFTKETIKPEEEPIEWHDPEDILETTKGLYPGEKIIVDRVLTVPKGDVFLHIALQCTAQISVFNRLLAGIRPCNERWTTTTVVAGKP